MLRWNHCTFHLVEKSQCGVGNHGAEHTADVISSSRGAMIRDWLDG